MLGEELGRTETLLYRRGNFNGTLDDVICDALLAERDAEIALSPGFRWGNSLLPGQADHLRGRLQRHRHHLSGRLPHDDDRRADSRTILEDVADNLFNPDPYYQQGGDMVRVGGLGYTIDVGGADGQPHLRPAPSAHRPAARGGERTTPSPAGPASTKAPKARRSGTWCSGIWRRTKVVAPPEAGHVKVVGG